jgi:hypothetical protein
MTNMKLISLAYHRNGCFGEGFWAVAFHYKTNGRDHPMIAAVFETQEMAAGAVHPCTGQLAVLDAGLAATGHVGQRWRGDEFEPQLRQWIAAEGEQWFVQRSIIDESVPPPVLRFPVVSHDEVLRIIADKPNRR